jgi:hypothetical protein
MKRLALTVALAALLAGYTAAAGAQSSPPALPRLTADQSADVQRQLDLYRTEIDGRVSRGEITADEADRLLKWREWQLAQQAINAMPPGAISDAPPIAASAAPPMSGDSTPPMSGSEAPPAPAYGAPQSVAPAAPVVRQYVYAPPPTVAYPAPYYYYPPYYYAPRPYYWGASVCAGGWGHHFGGRFCF